MTDIVDELARVIDPWIRGTHRPHGIQAAQAVLDSGLVVSKSRHAASVRRMTAERDELPEALVQALERRRQHLIDTELLASERDEARAALERVRMLVDAAGADRTTWPDGIECVEVPMSDLRRAFEGEWRSSDGVVATMTPDELILRLERERNEARAEIKKLRDVLTFLEKQQSILVQERNYDSRRADRAEDALERVRYLFADRPDTPCRTTWPDGIECVEVPMSDLRRALEGGGVDD